MPLGVDASTIHCTWSHNRNPITIDSVKYVRPGPRSLKINNVTGTDEGMYTCRYNLNLEEFSVDVANVYFMCKLTAKGSSPNLILHAFSVVMTLAATSVLYLSGVCFEVHQLLLFPHAGYIIHVYSRMSDPYNMAIK